MTELQKCLSAFAVAAWLDGLQSVKLADEAIERYLEPHRAAGTVRAALESLEQAYRRVGADNTVAAAIRIDLKGRLQRISDTARP